MHVFVIIYSIKTAVQCF